MELVDARLQVRVGHELDLQGATGGVPLLGDVLLGVRDELVGDGLVERDEAVEVVVGQLDGEHVRHDGAVAVHHGRARVHGLADGRTNLDGLQLFALEQAGEGRREDALRP